jgi:hypothetical protein
MLKRNRSRKKARSGKKGLGDEFDDDFDEDDYAGDGDMEDEEEYLEEIEPKQSKSSGSSRRSRAMARSYDQEPSPKPDEPVSLKIRIPLDKLRQSGDFAFTPPSTPSSTAPPTASATSGPASDQQPDADPIDIKVFYSEMKEATAKWGHLVFDFPHMALNQPTILLAFKAVTAKHTPLENWSPEDLDQLRSELETARAALKDFQERVGKESENLRSWKVEYDKLPPSSDGRKRRSLSAQIKEAADAIEESFLDRKRHRDEKGTPEGEETRKKSRGSVQKDRIRIKLKELSSKRRGGGGEEEDEIDVVDVEPPASQDEFATPKAPSTKKRERDRERNREKAKEKEREKEDTSTTKYNLKSRGQTKEGKPKRNLRDDMYVSPGEEDEEEHNHYGANTAHAFWAAMATYLRDFTDDDLNLLQQKPVSAEDPAFTVPPIGRRTFSLQSKRQDLSLEDEYKEWEASGAPENQPVWCGELTGRVLACFMTEKPVPTDSSPPSRDSMETEFAFEDASLPPGAPPTADYTFPGMLFVEDRIRHELKQLGLLEPEPLAQEGTPQEQVDEIGLELRKLHDKLRAQIAINNQSRAKIYPLVQKRMQDQDKERRLRTLLLEEERSYLRVLQRKKNKRKKSGTRRAI